MATVNIGQGNAGDQFYRYKMPRLQAKVGPILRVGPEFQSSPLPPNGDHGIQFRWLQVEGRGNGIKTCVVNNVEIAKALERPPECKPVVGAFSYGSCIDTH